MCAKHDLLTVTQSVLFFPDTLYNGFSGFLKKIKSRSKAYKIKSFYKMRVSDNKPKFFFFFFFKLGEECQNEKLPMRYKLVSFRFRFQFPIRTFEFLSSIESYTFAGINFRVFEFLRLCKISNQHSVFSAKITIILNVNIFSINYVSFTLILSISLTNRLK